MSNGRKGACPLLWHCASHRPVPPEPLMGGSLFVGVYNGDRSIGAANLRKGLAPSMAGAPCAPFYGSGTAAPFYVAPPFYGNAPRTWQTRKNGGESFDSPPFFQKPIRIFLFVVAVLDYPLLGVFRGKPVRGTLHPADFLRRLYVVVERGKAGRRTGIVAESSAGY